MADRDEVLSQLRYLDGEIRAASLAVARAREVYYAQRQSLPLLHLWMARKARLGELHMAYQKLSAQLNKMISARPVVPRSAFHRLPMARW